jgi:hypothetical protein
MEETCCHFRKVVVLLDKSADSPYPRLSNINKNHTMEDSYGRIKEQRAHPAGAAQQ